MLTSNYITHASHNVTLRETHVWKQMAAQSERDMVSRNKSPRINTYAYLYLQSVVGLTADINFYHLRASFRHCMLIMN